MKIQTLQDWIKRDRVVSGSALLTLFLAFYCLLSTAAAQETVIIPYDATKPIAAQNPDQRYVPYERFMQLWDDAKEHKRGPIPPAAPDKYLLDNARYEAVLDGKILHLTATIDLHTFGEGWVEVPLGFQQRQWSEVILDGTPAPYLNDHLLIGKAGSHHAVFISSEPFVPNKRTDWAMNIPKAAASLVVITLPGPGGVVDFKGDHPTIERIENGHKVVTTVLGSTQRLKVRIDMQASTLPPLTEADSVVVRNQLTTSPSWERIVSTADFDLAGSTLDHFSLFLPGNCQPLALNGVNIRSWKLISLPDGQRLDVSLTAPAQKTYHLELVTERLLFAGPRATPIITAAARRVENRVELVAGAGMAFRNVQPGDARQVTSEQPVSGLFAAYSLGRPGAVINYDTQPIEVKRKAHISTVYQVSHRKIEVIASLTLQAGDSTEADFLSDLTISIPSDFDLETVQSSSLRDWWRERNVLHLRFNPARGPVPLVLYLVRQFDTAPASLDLFPIRPDGFQTVTGEAVIAAHMGDETSLTLTGSAKQVAPETVAKDFSILAPLERKRAFTYTNADFSGKVSLSPLPLKLGAAWVTHVQAHEGWLAWQTKARMVVRQGSTRSVQFSLPIDLPEARVSGSEVRETSSKIDPKNPKRRLYDVALQNDLVTSTDLTIDLEQSAGIPVAALEFADLEREDGYLAAENVSDYEMSLDPKGLDVAQSSDLPFLPPLTTGASLYRLRPGWSLGVKLQRLEKTGSRAAFVAWAEITTAIREDGTEWNRIVWHLQNRSLQFLPVRLPAGGELVGVRVAGESVRADLGEVDGQKVTLIPLIKTRPGDISYDVEMIWRRTGLGKLGWLTGRSLDDPDLVGITVEKTLWNLYLPDNHPLTGDPDRVGNLDTVIAEVNRTEKLSGMLDELKSLNSVVLSRSESGYAREKAKENFDRLASDLEKETAASEPQGRLDNADLPPARRERALQQQADVSDLQSELKADLLKEKQKQAEDNNAKLPAQAEMPQSQAGERSKTWGFNGSYAQNSNAVVSRKVEAEPAAQAGQNQLFLNDGVVLNNASVTQIDRTRIAKNETSDRDTYADKKDFQGQIRYGTKITAGTLEIDSDDLRASKPQDFKAQGATASAVVPATVGGDVGEAHFYRGAALANPVATEEAQGNGQVVLGSARGNKLTIVATSGGAMAASAPGEPPLASPSTPPTTTSTVVDRYDSGKFADTNGAYYGRYATLTTTNAPIHEAGKDLGEMNINGMDKVVIMAQTKRAPAPSLGVKGRVSLNADFPLEGRVWHFKKLKANARLDFRVGSVPLTERWHHIGWFALAAGLLWMAGRLATKIRSPRLPLHLAR